RWPTRLRHRRDGYRRSAHGQPEAAQHRLHARAERGHLAAQGPLRVLHQRARAWVVDVPLEDALDALLHYPRVAAEFSEHLRRARIAQRRDARPRELLRDDFERQVDDAARQRRDLELWWVTTPAPEF